MRSSVLVAVFVLSGCVGFIGEADSPVHAPGPVVPTSPMGARLADTRALVDAVCGARLSSGHLALRRLSNVEYANTVRDLLFTSLNPTTAFHSDPLGTNGFSNDALALGTDEGTTTNYFYAAEALAADLLASRSNANGAWSRVVPCAATMTAGTRADCARLALEALAVRAYRRPLQGDELSRLMSVWEAGAVVDFETGFADAVVSMLLDPKFLFVGIVNEQSQNADAQFALDAHQLASRLSYFLWQTMPDEPLRAAADDGSLLRDDVLGAQVQRMLRDTKMTSMAATLRDEYAGLKSLSTPVPGVDDALRLAMVEETGRFIAGVIAEDRPYLELLTSHRTYVNGALATHYGVAFPGNDPAQFVAVDVPASQRRGLLTQPGVMLAMSGSASQTHPIRRGQWVAQRVLCADPPPRPPNLVFGDAPMQGLTPRQQLEQHSNDPACSGCHKLMDPIGFALENYDALGRWRTHYEPSQAPVVTEGVLPSGLAFRDGVDLFTQAAELPTVKSCFTKNFTNYALARMAASADDVCLAGVLAQVTSRPDSKFSDLVIGLVTSNAFRMQKGEAP